jgi:hypothetical protein
VFGKWVDTSTLGLRQCMSERLLDTLTLDIRFFSALRRLMHVYIGTIHRSALRNRKSVQGFQSYSRKCDKISETGGFGATFFKILIFTLIFSAIRFREHLCIVIAHLLSYSELGKHSYSPRNCKNCRLESTFCNHIFIFLTPLPHEFRFSDCRSVFLVLNHI